MYPPGLIAFAMHHPWANNGPRVVRFPVYSCSTAVPHRGTSNPARSRVMEIVQGILGALVTIVALIVIMGLIAALFMIIFGIATGIDDQIQQ